MLDTQYFGVEFTHSQWIDGPDGKPMLRKMTAFHSVLALSMQHARNIILSTHTFVMFKERK